MPSKDQKLLYQLEFEDEQLLFAKVSVSGVTTVPTKEELEVGNTCLGAMESVLSVVWARKGFARLCCSTVESEKWEGTVHSGKTPWNKVQGCRAESC